MMTSEPATDPKGERLQKFLGRAGVGSRRKCEQLIAEGRVGINGESATQLGVKVVPNRDIVTVDGVPVRPQKPLYLVLHKPKNCLCTSDDDYGRKTVLDFLPGIAQRIYTVGRLDYDAEGLLILTNDGDFAQRVVHPRWGIAKRYRVTVNGFFTREAAKALRDGVHLEGKVIQPLSLRVVSRGSRVSGLEIVISQGINRQIKRMLEQVGYKVVSIKRTRIGGVRLGPLKPGKFRRMTPSEIASFDGARECKR
jgi:23S rRNA pseudouridine2605 synthase